MSFVHPLLAWGALLGSVPIIIYILFRRRYRVVRWAAMELLLAAIAERSRRVRMEDLILLALRTLALVTAALAVARPILSPAAAEIAGVDSRGPDCVIVLDVSYSMGTNVGGQTRVAVARQRAHEVLAGLHPQTRAGVVYMSRQAVKATAGLLEDRTRIAAAIDAAEVTAADTDAAPAIDAALAMLHDSNAPGKRVYLITDAQAGAFDKSAATLRQKLAETDASVSFVVLTVPNPPVANLAITDLQLRSRWLRVGTPIQFEARLADVGEPAAAEANVELWVDGRKVDRRRVQLSGRRGAISFEHTFTAAGLMPVEVRLDPDAVEMDNHRYAAVCVPPAIEIAVVTAENAGELDSRTSPYTYLRAALSSGDSQSSAMTGLPFTVRPRATSSHLSDDVAGAWVVILADAGPLPAEEVKRLGRFVQQGGSVLLTAGPNAALSLGAFRTGGEAAGGWLADLTFSTPETAPADQPSAVQFNLDSIRAEPSDAESAGPAVIDLTSPGVPEAMAAVSIFQAVTLTPAVQNAWSVPLRLTDGRPALLTRDFAAADQQANAGAAGRLAVFTSSLDAAWCDLPYRPAFVPLLHDLFTWLSWHRLVSHRILPNETWVVTLPREMSGLKIMAPGGASLDAAAFTEPGDSGNEAHLRFERTDRPGVYQLGGGRTSPRVERDALQAVAVNVDPAESDQTVWSPTELISLFPQARCTVLPPDTPLDPVSLAGLSGTEAWAIVAGAILVFLLAETFLAYRFSLQKTV